MNAELSKTVAASGPSDCGLTISVVLSLCVVALAGAWLLHRDASDASARVPQRWTSDHGEGASKSADASAYALVPQPRSFTPPGSLFDAPGRLRADNAPRSSADVASPKLGEPAVVAPATEPRLPYVLTGRLRDGERWTVLLARGVRQEVATEGDVFDSVWLVEQIDERGIRFKYLPLGTYQHLAFTAGEPPGIGPQLGEEANPRAANTALPPMAGTAPRRAALPAAGAARAPGSESGAAVQAAAPVFQRRIASVEIPREPWVCEAARLNALVPCRNTWSMSEAERVACRKAADQRYNTCLSTALTAPAQEEGEDEGG